MLRIFPLWIILVIWTLQGKRHACTIQEMSQALAIMEKAAAMISLHKLNRFELWLFTKVNLWLAKEAIDLSTLQSMGVVSSGVSEK